MPFVCDSPPPALPPKKRQSAASPTPVAVVAPMTRGSSLPCNDHRPVRHELCGVCRCNERREDVTVFLCSCRGMSRSSTSGVSPGGAIPTVETLLVCLRAAVWENSASLMNSCPPWSMTAGSALETPAVRRLVRIH